MRSPATFPADEKNTKSKRKMLLISYGWPFKDNGKVLVVLFSSP